MAAAFAAAAAAAAPRETLSADSQRKYLETAKYFVKEGIKDFLGSLCCVFWKYIAFVCCVYVILFNLIVCKCLRFVMCWNSCECLWSSKCTEWVFFSPWQMPHRHCHFPHRSRAALPKCPSQGLFQNLFSLSTNGHFIYCVVLPWQLQRCTFIFLKRNRKILLSSFKHACFATAWFFLHFAVYTIVMFILQPFYRWTMSCRAISWRRQ